MAKKEGQGCFLLKSGSFKKVDGKSQSQPHPKHFDLPSATCVWDGKSQSTHLLTCSDKLLLWQHLGFAAEYNMFGRRKNEFPIVDSIPDIRLATIVVGRKFSLHHLERALFLRLPKNLRKHTVSCLVTAKKFDLSKFECGGSDVLKRSIESEVEIDNDGEKCAIVIENDVHSNAKHEDGQNAKFGGNCFLYFRNGLIRNGNDDQQQLSLPETEAQAEKNEADGIVEVLNPHTGFILNKNRKNDDNTEMSENKDNIENKMPV